MQIINWRTYGEPNPVRCYECNESIDFGRRYALLVLSVGDRAVCDKCMADPEQPTPAKGHFEGLAELRRDVRLNDLEIVVEDLISGQGEQGDAIRDTQARVEKLEQAVTPADEPHTARVNGTQHSGARVSRSLDFPSYGAAMEWAENQACGGMRECWTDVTVDIFPVGEQPLMEEELFSVLPVKPDEIVVKRADVEKLLTDAELHLRIPKAAIEAMMEDHLLYLEELRTRLLGE